MIFLFCIIAYIIGSIPFGYIFAKLLKGLDIREHGSGNVGATNVFRVVGKKWGLVVLFLDALKGGLCLLLVSFVTDSGVPVVYLKCLFGICAVLGHNFTIFLKFKGGKGVATSCGVLLFLFPKALLSSFVLFVLIVIFTKYISLGSIFGAIFFPFFMLVFYNDLEGKNIFFIFSILFALFIILRHRANIKRLFNGTENKIKFSN